jgi:PIN domain nuclease of toxin-antitoxin system
VNGYLLDTHVILRATIRPDELSSQIKRAIVRGPVTLSVLSWWEVVIKSMKGKLDVGDHSIWWHAVNRQMAATQLPLKPSHVEEILSLSPIHADPFDRALIAQAQAEKLVLVTTDASIARYASSRLRILSQ